MNDHEVQRFARTLAEIAHTLEHVDHASDRVERVLVLTRELVPYQRISLLDLEGDGRRMFTIPSAEHQALTRLTLGLTSAWRRIVDELDELPRLDGMPPSLTLPVMGLDRINGIIRVDCPDDCEYDATHLRLLSVVAAQLGAFLAMIRMRGEQARHNAELAAAVEFQQVLAGVVGHDLRSPLSVIVTVATMLRDTTTDPFQLRALDRAFNSAQRASRLISDLIDVTECRVQGTMPVRRRRVDARGIVADAVDEARVAYPDRSIELAFETDEPMLGHWDPDRLAELLTNLINNALEHGDGSPVRVTLHGDRDTISLAVHNAGVPIPEPLLPTLFDPFKRGASTRAVGKHGLGLGLYIVDQIARAHDGRVTAVSSPGGTTFTVVLPREAALRSDAAPA